ncbi:MAG: hypothetical protein JW795_03335, partial [Chitinivibrionales bacterium]|nr:hypothetical protein [Chitinivibrionales bacterium]
TEFPSTLRAYGKESNQQILSILNGLVFETLLSFEFETMEYKPLLATHWKISEDKKTYWFRINPDARWSDGNPVIAADVIATWKLLIDDGIEEPSSKMTWSKYEYFEESRYIVKVVIKEDDWKLFLWASQSMLILPSHYLSKIDGKGYLQKYQDVMMPGTGPYVLDGAKTQKGTQIVMRRRSDYWAQSLPQRKGMFNFDELKMVVVADDNLQKEKFKKGDFDLYGVNRAAWWVNEFNLEDKAFEALNRGLIKKRKIYNYEPKGLSGLAFNMRKPPFDDIRIRKAFAMLWNIDQLNEKLFFNEYQQVTSSFPGSIYANPDNVVYRYNPSEASKLLDAAGWKKRNKEGLRVNSKGEIFELELPISQSFERVFTPYQEELKKAGIKLNLKITDGNTTWNIVNERRFSFVLMSWTGLLFPNPETSLHSSLADQNNNNNINGLKNKQIDSLIAAYNKEYDTKKRVEQIRQIDKILSETVYYAYGWHAPYTARIVFWDKFGMPENILGYTGIELDAAFAYWWYDEEKVARLEKAKADKSIVLPQGDVNVDFWKVRK